MKILRKITNKLKEKDRNIPKIIVYSTISFVFLSWLLVYLIDVLNVFDLRSFFVGRFDTPYFFYHWFLIPIEVMQWPILGLCIFVFALCAGVAYTKRSKDLFAFTSFMSIGLIFMLVEDAGDVRHILRRYVGHIAGESSDYSAIVTLAELLYFAAIASVLLFTVIKFRSAYWQNIQARKYLFLGFLFYGVAVSSSWMGNAFRAVTDDFRDFYTFLGERFISPIFLSASEDTQELYVATSQLRAERGWPPLEFEFFDLVYEESLELIGAGFLLAAGTALFISLKNSQQENVSQTDK